jgi:hypothetical protein
MSISARERNAELSAAAKKRAKISGLKESHYHLRGRGKKLYRKLSIAFFCIITY